MILDEEIKVRWHHMTCDHYLSKGYGPYKNQEVFTVKVEDIQETSHVEVNIQCDYCDTKRKVEFRNYYTAVTNTPIKKYACQKCTKKKAHEHNLIKNELGTLTKNDLGYYKIRENRLKELDEYMKKHKTVDGIWDKPIYCTFSNHGDDILQALEEIGYNTEELRNQKPKGFWTKDKIIEMVNGYISIYKRFPTKDEMINELNLNINFLYKEFGTIANLKKEMGYKERFQLIDRNGDYNRSTYELAVANYLIAQNVKYKREKYPFPKKLYNYRSDFLIKQKGKTYHIEIWGFPKNDQGERGIYYNKKRKDKEKLYKQYNINLISIDFEVFYRKSYDEIEEQLYQILNPHFNLKQKKIPSNMLFSNERVTEEEMLTIIMKESNYEGVLPPVATIQKKHAWIYQEIKMRYGDFKTFAEKYGLITARYRKRKTQSV